MARSKAAGSRRETLVDLPIRWKILIPFALLSLAYAISGTWVFSRATAAREIAGRSARLRDDAAVSLDKIDEHTLRLARVARRLVFTQGVAAAVARSDRSSLRTLVVPGAVEARTAVTLIAGGRGEGLLEVDTGDRRSPRIGTGADWAASPFLRGFVGKGAAQTGTLATALVDHGGIVYLAVAAPIPRGAGPPVGVGLVAEPVAGVVAEIADLTGATVGLADLGGRVLAGTEIGAPAPGAAALQTRGSMGGRPVDILSVPIKLSGERVATLVIGLPAASGLGLLGRDAWLIGFVAVAALVGVTVVGTWVARRLSRPLVRLLESTRALQAGELAHRAVVDRRDEVGTLAASFNQMAGELEGSRRDLERRVDERTHELAEAMEHLDKTNAELSRANEAKSAFLANVSHELRTPLSGILIASEMLHDPAFGMLSEAKVRDLAGKIMGSGRHLLALIDDLLDLARIEAGRLELRPQPVAVGPLLAEVRSAIQPLASKDGVTLAIAPARGVRILADPVRVRQVLFNLLTNALRSTPKRGRVSVEARASKGMVAISVRDTGAGIDRRDQRRIFEAFEQVSGRPGQGAGLGLTISRRIAEAHGGRLTVSSALGKGSTFTLTVPAAGDGAATAASQKALPPTAARAGRVLVVEDDPVSLDLVTRSLAAGGHTVDQATTPSEALHQVRAGAPDLVLLDVSLGQSDGLDVARALRADPATRHLPVVALSAHGLPRDIDRALAAGCDAYIVKPIGGRALLSRVSEILGSPRRVISLEEAGRDHDGDSARGSLARGRAR